MVAGTTGEGVALAAVRSIGLGLASHCGVGKYRSGRCSGLCLLSRRWLRQQLWRRARQVRALLGPLFAGSACAHPATVVACKICEGAALATVRTIGVCTSSLCGVGHES